MDLYCRYFLYFIIYSFIGWLLEVICKLVEEKRFVYRGFLIGPICPIYGYGVLTIILLIGKPTSDILGTFLKAILVCSILEYFTSYFMEKLFHARWWDYSKNKFNINGRICLETMIPFGLLGCFVVYILHPLVVGLVGCLSETVIIVLAIILFVLYIADNVVSCYVLTKIKFEMKKIRYDSTEIIRKKVSKWIDSHSILYRHIKEAFPQFKVYKRNKRKKRSKNK